MSRLEVGAVLRWIARIAGTLAVGLAAVLVVFFVGMRTKQPLVQTGVRRFNKAVTNPIVLRSAGAPGASAARIRHVGRTSGRSYETPVGPFPTGDGFLIALPYGPGTDWVRNVLASGSATLVHEGDTFQIVEPEVVLTADVVDELPAAEQRTLRLFAVEECLRVRRAA